eukprot:951580_1
MTAYNNNNSNMFDKRLDQKSIATRDTDLAHHSQSSVIIIQRQKSSYPTVFHRYTCAAFLLSVLFLLLTFPAATFADDSSISTSSTTTTSNSNSNSNSDGDGDYEYIDFETDVGGIPYNYSVAALQHNSQALGNFLQQNANDTTLFLPDKTFHFHPGIYGQYIHNFKFLINGTMRFHRPAVTLTNHYDRPEPGILLDDSMDILISSPEPYENDDTRSSGKNSDNDDEIIDSDYGRHKRGVVDGHGADYWGIPGIGYLPLGEFRPDLLVMNRTSNALIEYIIFRDSGLYTLHLHDMDNLKIRYTSIVARRTTDASHGGYDLSAFNTDGIDVSGNNVHVHDVDIWNQDDCIAVKDAPSGISQNMLFERVNASGLGLTVGSIGGTAVKNITFRDSFLYRTSKGIYMKFRIDEWRETPGLIEDVVYENITMIEPEWWGVWIGPAQQSISGNICHPSPCSMCWPKIPFTECNGMKGSQYKNITLKDVYIHRPLGSPGVILADESAPIDGMTFDNVIVTDDVPAKWQNIDLIATFPGLMEPIQDEYMHPLYVWCYSIGLGVLALVIITILGYGIFRFVKWNPSTKGGNEKNGTFYQKKTLIAILGTAVLAIIVQNVVKTQEETENTSHYFMCEGVVNGKATGDTWPIPSCFADETGGSNDNKF